MATVTYHEEGQPRENPRRSILVLGAPGSGKTRFAGTFPSPLWCDYEQGAESALRGGCRPQTLSVTTEKSTLTTTIDIVKAIQVGEFDRSTRLSTFTYSKQEFTRGTLVVDPINRIQAACKQFDILGNRNHMEREDWDTINNKMVPLLLALNSLPINVVVTCHVKPKDGYTNKKTGIRFPNEVHPMLQGALRDALPGYFDIVVHLIISNSKGDRALVTSEKTFQGYKLVGAKDRHRLLYHLLDEKTGTVPLPCDKSGYPSSDVAYAVCGKSKNRSDQ